MGGRKAIPIPEDDNPGDCEADPDADENHWPHKAPYLVRKLYPQE